jgi:dihydroorotase
MSKFINLGMPLKEVIRAATWKSAQVIGRTDLGHLEVGAVADVAVFNLLTGAFGFVDSGGNRMTGPRKLDTELTIRAGQVVWDLNGISHPDWDR